MNLIALGWLNPLVKFIVPFINRLDIFFKYNVRLIKNLYKPMLQGLQNTLIISFFALIIGVVLGTILAVIKVIPKKGILKKIFDFVVNIYISFFRGTPVVVQLLLFYFGVLGPRGYSPLYVAIMVLGLNSSAYVAESVRSGILAVDHGQMEAGRSLGLTYGSTMWHIILPQAIKNILPALGNELIALIKETAVVGFIAVFDLTRAARAVVSDTYDAFGPYLYLALVYLVIVLIATFFVTKLERRLRQSDKR